MAHKRLKREDIVIYLMLLTLAGFAVGWITFGRNHDTGELMNLGEALGFVKTPETKISNLFGVSSSQDSARFGIYLCAFFGFLIGAIVIWVKQDKSSSEIADKRLQ